MCNRLALDTQLLERILFRDSLALEHLYDTYERLLFTVAYRVSGKSEMAEQAVNAVFKELWNNSASFYNRTELHLSSCLIQLCKEKCKSAASIEFTTIS